jgi:hypothetical protein
MYYICRMKEIKYKLVQLEIDITEDKTIEEVLTEYDKEGWELVTMQWGNTQEHKYMITVITGTWYKFVLKTKQ